MPEFNYIARNQDGVRVENSISANNLKEASDMLVSDNLSIIKISERDTLINEKNQIIEDLTRQLEDQKEDSDGHRRRAEKAENDYRRLQQNDQFYSMLGQTL